MKVEMLDSFTATGLAVRTTNKKEMDATTATIGVLWQQFSTQVVPKLSEESNVYGVYTNYDSDHTGEFDVIACSDDISTEQLPESTTVSINSGKYLSFSGEGEMPQVVIELWQQIWAYFMSPDCPHQRAFTTDFEHYTSDDAATVYIAIL